MKVRIPFYFSIFCHSKAGKEFSFLPLKKALNSKSLELFPQNDKESLIKLNIILALVLTLFFCSYSEVKVPEVVFPLEITTKITEEKPYLEPPNTLELKTLNEELNITQYIKPKKPTDVQLPVLTIEKPTAYLGIPPSNALLSDAIDYYNKGDLLFAESSLEKFIEKYKDHKNLFYAYYLLGVVKYNLGKYPEAESNLSKSCEILKTKEACLSSAIVNIMLGNQEKAKSLLSQLDKDIDVSFYNQVINLLSGGKANFNNIKCDNLDIGSIEYCQYIQKYYNFSVENFLKALKIKYAGKNKQLLYDSILMDGFSYYYTGDYQNALGKFNLILKENTNGYVYNLALYGKALIDSNNIDDYAGVLQSRDELLAHYLYIKLANERFKKGDYLDAFIYFQNAIKLTDKNKTYLKLAIATSLYNLKNYDYALKLFSDLTTETNDPEVFYYAGITAYAVKDLAKAEKFLNKASESKDLEIRKKALMYLAEIYLMNKDDENFVNTASQLKEFDKTYAYDLLGWYFYLNGDYQNAFKAFNDPYMKAVSAFNAGDLEAVKNIIQNRNDRKSKFLLVYVYIKEDDLEKAREVLKELLKGDDLIAKKAYYLYAYTFFSSGDFVRASQEFSKFLEKYKYDDDIYTRKALLRLADSYYNLGERDLAVNIYKDFITKYSGTKDSIDAAYNLIILESKGSSEDVESMIRDFLAKYPNYPLANILKIQLAEIYQNKGKIEDAVKIYQEVAASNGKESALATYKLAECYYKLNQLDKAKKVLTDYLNTNNEEYKIPSKLLLAEIYEKQNDLDNSIKIYEELKENDDVKFKLAKILLQKGDYDKALAYFKELLEKYPEKVNELGFYIGKTYYLMNDEKDAVSYLENGTKSSNYNDAAESYYLLGMIYKKENPNKALNYFLNGIYLYPEAKDITAKSRIEAAKILLKAEKRKEASCLLTPLQNYEDENIKNTAINILKDLPKCVR